MRICPSIHPSFCPVQFVQSLICQVNITIHASVYQTASLHTGFPTVHLLPIYLATYRPPTHLLTTYLTAHYPHTNLLTRPLPPLNHLLSYYRLLPTYLLCRLPTYRHASLSTYLPTYLPTYYVDYLHTGMPHCLPTTYYVDYLHTGMPPCLPTY
jgi:hypothetical protein